MPTWLKCSLTVCHEIRQGLIAVNYPARDKGIGRHCNVTEAKKLCPDLVAQHVATWREGDDKWAYRDDAAANIATDKVSLDPYRLESRKILALVKEFLPQNLQKVEKASIDEVFLDLSAHVRTILLERFPELAQPPPYDDPTEKLPLPSIAALDWQADALVDLDEEQESRDPDWDDVAILIGSEIVRDVRAQVRETLKYTCSAGIANNKMISKLGSGFKKPNSQTVVRSRAIRPFLADFKVTKIRNLGGKLGDQVVSAFNTDSVKELLDVPLEQLQGRLGDETGVWLHNTLRGVDNSEVNSRTQLKSMLSAKSFRPSINSEAQAVMWLRIFVGDIYSRLVEEGVLDNKRRPRSINLHHRHAGQTRSKQSPIPPGQVLDEKVLFHLAKDLLNQIMTEGRVWPCANLSLSVGGFEDGVKGNMGIGAFLVKGGDAVASGSRSPEKRPSEDETQSSKRSRTKISDIQTFFSKNAPHIGEEDMNQTLTSHDTKQGTPQMDNVKEADGKSLAHARQRSSANDKQSEITEYLCDRCHEAFTEAVLLQSHQDWHMAKELQEEDRTRHTEMQASTSSRNSTSKGTSAPSKRGRGGRIEQGQRKLNFG